MTLQLACWVSVVLSLFWPSHTSQLISRHSADNHFTTLINNIIWDSLLTVPPVRERVVPMVERGARESHAPVLPDIPLMGRELMDMFFRGGMVLLIMVMALFPTSCTLRYHHADKQDKTFHDECHTSTVQTLLPNLRWFITVVERLGTWITIFVKI